MSSPESIIRRIMRATLPRLVILLAAAGLVAMLGTGCEQDVTVGGGDNESTDNDGQNQDNDNHGHPHDDEYFEHHGPDDDMELIDAGVLQGSWRAAFADGDVPLAYFDIFHDDGASTADGDFMMGPAISDMLDGTTGEIDGVTLSGSNLQVEWNPTTDDGESYLMDLERDDEDRYTGQFSAERYPETHDVTFTRQQFED